MESDLGPARSKALPVDSRSKITARSSRILLFQIPHAFVPDPPKTAAVAVAVPPGVVDPAAVGVCDGKGGLKKAYLQPERAKMRLGGRRAKPKCFKDGRSLLGQE